MYHNSQPLISVASARLNGSFLEPHIKESLRWIKQSDLEGIRVIKLDDKMAKVSKQAAMWAQTASHSGERVYGWYCPLKEKTPAFIVLYVNEICHSIPSVLRRGPLLTLRLTRSLAHEVAHHLRATRGYILQNNENNEEEMLADLYAEEVTQRMIKNWRYRFSRFVLKEIASWHYAFGQVDWRQKHFADSANHFFSAWDLDRENGNASNWYWRAKEMSESSQLE